ncbi:N-6 DNA methylase [Trichormus sp. NMC-1]|uniref:N-6 DNA methylase n=1 Tax=Trichormus sp. NMC-1 TaxID=1853259 RepID=UPI0008DC0984|nr:N-6 DNA methylase [Trichormus sp. NMC-1]
MKADLEQLIFDPACGSGGLLREAIKTMKKIYHTQDKQQINPCFVNMDFIKDIVSKSHESNIKHGDIFSEEINSESQFKYDFIVCTPPCIYNEEYKVKILKEHIIKRLSNKGRACIALRFSNEKHQFFNCQLLTINKNLDGDVIEKSNLLENNLLTSIASIDFAYRQEKAYVCNISEIKLLRKYQGCDNVGVYFIIGETKDKIINLYIGESEDIYRRLLEHKRSQKHDFWNNTYFILSKDNILNKGNIRYLEFKFIELAKQSNKIIPTNKRGYRKPPNLKPSDKKFTEDFFKYCKDLLAELGLNFE